MHKFERMLKEEPEILGAMLLMMWVEDDLLTEEDASKVASVLEVDELVRILNAEMDKDSESVLEALILTLYCKGKLSVDLVHRVVRQPITN